MKIFIIPSWYPYPENPVNGTFFRDHAKALVKAGHDVTVVAVEIASLKSFGKLFPPHSIKKYDDEGIKTYQQVCVNHHPKNEKGFYSRYCELLDTLLTQALKEEGKPDLIHVHSSLWAGAALAEMKLDIPFIVSEHIKEFLIPGGFSIFQQGLINSCYKHAKAVIAPSQAVLTSIKTNFTLPENCGSHCVGNMVDTDYFKPMDDKPFRNRFTFLIVSLLRKEKQIPMIIRAFSPVANTHLAKIRIVGDGPEYKNIKNEIAFYSLERQVELVRETGRDAVRHHMQRADAFLLYSKMETFGVTLIEAMACGLPVISSKAGGPDDFVNKTNGILVKDNNNIHELTDAMKQMGNNYENYDPNKIRENIVNNYSQPAIVSKLEKIYSSYMK